VIERLLEIAPTIPATLILVRHGATEANLARPPRLQGRRSDPPLAPLGVRQAEVARDLLAAQPFDACYCSPLFRAAQTASIIARPHGLSPIPLEVLTECDVGRWEGLDWDAVRRLDPDGHDRFQADPAAHGYPGGESFAQVDGRAGPGLDGLLSRPNARCILVVSHHVVLRTYLAGFLGLPLARAREVVLSNCGVSIVIREGAGSNVVVLDDTRHLLDLAGA
jgi:broad specificity phosphatase PhoE